MCLPAYGGGGVVVGLTTAVRQCIMSCHQPARPVLVSTPPSHQHSYVERQIGRPSTRFLSFILHAPTMALHTYMTV